MCPQTSWHQRSHILLLTRGKYDGLRNTFSPEKNQPWSPLMSLVLNEAHLLMGSCLDEGPKPPCVFWSSKYQLFTELMDFTYSNIYQQHCWVLFVPPLWFFLSFLLFPFSLGFFKIFLTWFVGLKAEGVMFDLIHKPNCYFQNKPTATRTKWECKPLLPWRLPPPTSWSPSKNASAPNLVRI